MNAAQAFNSKTHGGTAHMLRHRPTNDGWIVLCHRPNHEHEPYVTWSMDRDGNTYLGHYFATRGEAGADYSSRR